jgi:hypothetical protein
MRRCAERQAGQPGGEKKSNCSLDPLHPLSFTANFFAAALTPLQIRARL